MMENKNRQYYLLFILILFCSSFIRMSIDSGWDNSKYFNPLQEFLMNIFVIGIIPTIISIIIGVFTRFKFFIKTLIWLTLIISIVVILGQIRYQNLN